MGVTLFGNLMKRKWQSLYEQACTRHARNFVHDVGQCGDLEAYGLFLHSEYNNMLSALEYASRRQHHSGSALIFRLVSLLYPYWETHSLYEPKLLWAREAVKVAHANGDLETECYHLDQAANACLLMGRLDEALKLYMRALKLAWDIRNNSYRATILNSVGVFFNHRAKYSKALGYLRKAREIAEQRGDRLFLGLVLDNLAEAYRGLNDTGGAESCEKIVEQIANTIEEPSEKERAVYSDYERKLQYWNIKITSSRTRSLRFFREGNLEEAIESENANLALAREYSNIPVQIVALGQIGKWQWYRGRTKEALAFYRRALALAQEWSNPSLEAWVLQLLGNALAVVHQPDEAVGYLLRAMEISRQTMDEPLLLRILIDLAHALTGKGQAQDAIDHLDEAETISIRIEEGAIKGSIHGERANALASMGQLERALEQYADAVRISRDWDDTRCLAVWIGNKGATHFKKQDYDMAVRCYEEALSIACRSGNLRSQALWLGNLGEAHLSGGEGVLAIDNLLRSKTLAAEIGASNLVAFADKCLEKCRSDFSQPSSGRG